MLAEFKTTLKRTAHILLLEEKGCTQRVAGKDQIQEIEINEPDEGVIQIKQASFTWGTKHKAITGSMTHHELIGKR